MAFDNGIVEGAFAKALPLVEQAFRDEGLEPTAIIINATFVSDDLEWAGASTAKIDVAARGMMQRSLRLSAEEIGEVGD